MITLFVLAETAEAQYGGMHRRTRRRTAIVVASATHAADQQAAANQQSQQATQPDSSNSAQGQQQIAQQEQTTPQTSAQGDHLPYGKVVNSLPEGCESEAVNEQQYYHCGNDYYRAAYQGNALVYVTTEPPK
ncbi:MAG TPA: DUF6515 family protein [Bacteroidales bacterium]